MAIQLAWRDKPLTRDQAAALFFATLEDDREDSPWMTMGDLQFWSASSLAHSLRSYAHELALPWYVASMLPIRYAWSKSPEVRQLAPDLFVAFVPEQHFSSFDVPRDGAFPPFVLEVVSPSSSVRDRNSKLEAYDYLAVKEYVLFTPRYPDVSTLEGFRRSAQGVLEPVSLDEEGRLWSEVLELHFAVNGTLLQAQTAEGRLLLTPEQAEEARREAEAERRAAEEARQAAEVEVKRLRQEIDRLRSNRE